MQRKSNTVYTITPALLLKVEMLAGEGLQNNQIAVSLGWSTATYYKKKSENQEFAEAIKKGETSNIREVVNALTKRARGYTVEETTGEETTSVKMGVTNKTTVRVKHIIPDTVACIFLLVNRDPDNWRHKSEQLLTAEVNVGVAKIGKDDAKVIKNLFDGLVSKEGGSDEIDENNLFFGLL